MAKDLANTTILVEKHIPNTDRCKEKFRMNADSETYAEWIISGANKMQKVKYRLLSC